MYLDPNDDALRAEQIQQDLDRLSKGFMTPEFELGDWIEFEDWHCETSFYPVEVHELDLADIPDGSSVTITHHKNKWGARLSASGYMDCTDWLGPFDTREEAERELVYTYGDDDAIEEED